MLVSGENLSFPNNNPTNKHNPPGWLERNEIGTRRLVDWNDLRLTFILNLNPSGLVHEIRYGFRLPGKGSSLVATYPLQKKLDRLWPI